MPKRIVITGGPGSGKTSLISQLEQEGYTCQHEISRQVTLEAQAQGITQLFLEDPLLFSEKLIYGRLKQFDETADWDLPWVFFDRGMPDVTAYMDYLGTSYDEPFKSLCRDNRYDMVFILPPWEAIYIQDNERYESYEQAFIIYDFLRKGYEGYGYTLISVPMGDLNSRIQFIREQLSD